MKFKIGIIVGLVVTGVTLLVLATMRNDEYTKGEYPLHQYVEILEKSSDSIRDRHVSLFGKVKEGSLRKVGVEAEFIMVENGIELPVYFNGKTLLPQTFKDGVDVTVDGVYDFANQRFESDKISAKCDSKYGSNAVNFPVEEKKD